MPSVADYRSNKKEGSRQRHVNRKSSGRRRFIFVIVWFLWTAGSVFEQAAAAQRIENTSNGTLVATITFGTLTPGLSNSPSSVSVQFRLRNNAGSGYHLEVSSV